MPKQPKNVHVYDGIKSIPLSQIQNWESFLGFSDQDSGMLATIYRTVPYLYAAIQSRVEAVSATPWNLYPFGKKASDSDPVTDDYPELVAILENLLPITEGALCLYGCAYWLVETNRYGRNPTPRWALPTSILPKYDASTGLIGFQRTYSTGSAYFPLDDKGLAKGLVYFWLHSLTAEESYDISPAQVALRDACASGALVEFADRFFSRGAVKQTLLMVPEDSDPSEVERLRSWWHRVFRGVGSVNQAEVLRQNVEAVTIGEGIKDLSNEELDTMLRRHIGSAFRVPESILVSSASNFAISQQDWLTFWEICIKPEVKRLRRIINVQFLQQFGVYMWEEPERLEFYQRNEVEKAQALTLLVGAGLITLDEARDMLEYGPMPIDELAMIQRQFGLLKAGTEAGLSIEQSAEIIGLDLSETEEEDPEETAAFDEMDAEAQAEFDEDEERDGGVISTSPSGKSVLWLKYYELKRASGGRGRGGGHWQQQTRDARGRFAKMPGSEKRSGERTALQKELARLRGQVRERQKAERRDLTARHKSERQRGAIPFDQTRDQVRERHKAERRDLTARHKSERDTLRTEHGLSRAKQRLMHQSERGKEVETHVEEMRKNNPKAMTRAYGNDPNKAYEMRTRVVDMGDVKASNTSTGAVNPDYDQILQPRDRTRVASQLQIDNVAKNMVSDAVLMDFHQIDKGSPIIDADGNVLSGNGRTLALQRMKERYPGKWQEYQDNLRRQAREHGISDGEIASMKTPILVRELVGDEDRVRFAQEANNPPVLQMSPLERAKVDVRNMKDTDIEILEVGDEGIDIALRQKKNSAFIQRFMGTLSDNERAQLIRADGSINKAGIERIKAMLFTRTFPGDSGGRLAETFLEAVDSDTKNVENAISGALPRLAKAEGLIQAGHRDRSLSLTGDFAKAVEVQARLKESGINLNDYFNQTGMFGGTPTGRETTKDQEHILYWLDQNSRKPKVMRETLLKYADFVENAPSIGETIMPGLDMGTATSKERMMEQLFGERPTIVTQGGIF